MPAEEKTVDKASEKALRKALDEEHARHVGELERAVDDFDEKAAATTVAEVLREYVKDLRDAVRDELAMHRAKAVACFRAFKPELEKAFDKKAHLKALREEHDAYEAKHKAALDEFEELIAKAEAGSVDEHVERIGGLVEASARAHRKAVAKAVKAMCKAAFCEEDQADERTLAVLREFLTPHVDPLILNALALKIGAKISGETKKRLAEAHQLLNAAKAVLEDLHPDLADGSGEESRSDEDDKSSPAPANPRSRTRTPSREDDELNAHLRMRETVRGIEAAAREALGKLNADLRARRK